jgi:MFS family permease
MVAGLVGGSLGVLVVALAPNVPVVLAGWCLAQLSFNALLAVMVAVLPDQVPVTQRGLVAGVLGVCVPVASVIGTFLVTLFTGNQVAMFLAPCAVGGFFILLFVITFDDFAWAFASRFMFVLAYAFLTTYQAYYLLDKIGSTEADVPRQIFLGTLVQSLVVVVAAPLGGRCPTGPAAGRSSS